MASAINARDACSEPSTSSTWSSATCSSFNGPARVEPQRDPGALQEDRVGRHVRVRGAQRAVPDAVPDHLAEDRLVVVALGDQRPPRPLGERPDLAVGHERRAPVDAVEDDVLAHRRGQAQRRALMPIHGRDDLLGQRSMKSSWSCTRIASLLGVPVVDRRRLHPRRGPDRTHRGRVVAAPGEQLERRPVDGLSRPGATPARRASVLWRRRSGPALGSRPLSQAAAAPGLILGRDLAPQLPGHVHRHLDQRRVRRRHGRRG